jgi:hypothetical protein
MRMSEIENMPQPLVSLTAQNACASSKADDVSGNIALRYAINGTDQPRRIGATEKFDRGQKCNERELFSPAGRERAFIH